MAENSKIQWTDNTFNPWIGCTKVSAGCANCYAEHSTPVRTARAKGKELWGKGAARQRTSAAYWKQPLKWNAEIQEWRERPCADNLREVVDQHPSQKVFPSLCDIFDGEVPVEILVDFLELIFKTPNLIWQLLTKRPENFWGHEEHRGKEYFKGRLEAAQEYALKHQRNDLFEWLCLWGNGVAPKNVWIGTSVENQTTADKRIPELLKIPARVRFLSAEPLLGPIDLAEIKYPSGSGVHCFNGLSMEGDDVADDSDFHGARIDWVIVGGESGPGARPCDVEWIEKIVDQCKTAAVACFVKQMGSNPIFSVTETGFNPPMSLSDGICLMHPKGGDMGEWPEYLRVRQFPEVTRA